MNKKGSKQEKSNSGYSILKAVYQVNADVNWKTFLPPKTLKAFEKEMPLCNEDAVGVNLHLSKAGMRVDWSLGKQVKAFASLIHKHRKPPVLLDHKSKTRNNLKQLEAARKDDWVEVVVKDQKSESKFGATVIHEFKLLVGGDYSPMRLRIEVLSNLPVQCPCLPTWWDVLFPVHSSAIRNSGILVRLKLWSEEDQKKPSMGINLADMSSSQENSSPFLVSKDYTNLEPRTTDAFSKSTKKQANKRRHLIRFRQNLAGAEPDSQKCPERYYSIQPNEDIKVIVRNDPLEKIVNAVNQACSYLESFSGRRFIVQTDEWIEQVIRNTARPPNNQSPSVLDGLLIRAGVFMLALSMGKDLKLDKDNTDIPKAISLLAEGATKKRWDFVWNNVQNNQILKDALQELIALDIPNCGNKASNDFAYITALLACADPIIGRHSPVDSVDFQTLGRFWMASLLQQISFIPDLPSRRQDPDAEVFWSSTSREMRLEGLGELIDVSLSDWEHEIDIGRQVLFDPLQYIPGELFNTLANLFPHFSDFGDTRFGFFTTIKLKKLATSFDIDTTPTAGPGPVILGVFCPPCVLALFQTGFVDVDANDIEIPVGILAQQDPRAFAEPEFKVIIGEISSDIDVGSFVLGIFPLLTLVINVVTNVFADTVLESMLKSLSDKIKDPIQDLINQAPTLTPDLLVTLGFEEMHRNFLQQVQNAEQELQTAVNNMDQTAQNQAQAKVDNAFLRYENSRLLPAIEQAVYSGRAGAEGVYQLEVSAALANGRNSFGPLVFPPAGTNLDSDFAIVMSQAYFQNSFFVWHNIQFSGPLQSLKPNGTLSELDWWQEAPDQTGMPPRPQKAKKGQPPPILLTPAATQHPGFWGYSSLIFVWPGQVVMRELNDVNATEPVADLIVSAWVDVGASHFKAITYQVCEDVPPLVREIVDPWDGLGPRPGVGPGPDPIPGFNEPGFHSHTTNNYSLQVVSTFQRMDEVNDSHGLAGPFDNVRYTRTYPGRNGGNRGIGPDGLPGGFDGGLEPGAGGLVAYTPDPNDHGPAQQPGTMLCKWVTAWNTDEKEYWLKARLTLQIPVHIGFVEQLHLTGGDDFAFFPAMGYRLDMSSIVANQVQFSKFDADGPLATLDLLQNREWIKSIMIDKIKTTYEQRQLTELDDLSYKYPDQTLLDFFPELEVELLKPSAQIKLQRMASFESSLGQRNLALQLDVNENVLTRV